MSPGIFENNNLLEACPKHDGAHPGLLKNWGCSPVYMMQDLNGSCCQRGLKYGTAAFHLGSPRWKPNLSTRSRHHSSHAAFHTGSPRWERIWLPGTLLNQTKLPPRRARWRAANWNSVAIWWPDRASIHARWTACRGIRNSRTRHFAAMNKNGTTEKGRITSSIPSF